MASSKGKQVVVDLNPDQRNVRFTQSNLRVSHSQSQSQSQSRTSSTETVLYYPKSASEDLLPGSSSGLRWTATYGPALSRVATDQSHLPPKVLRIHSGISQVLGFPPRDAPLNCFDAQTTQISNWELPKNISNTLEYQARHYDPGLPRNRSYEQQALAQNRIFDPEKGLIYSGCTQCDPTGGPTDCQHPEDPTNYSTELNPIPKGDPAYHLCHPVEPVPTNPERIFPGSKLISKPSPSKAAVTPEDILSGGCRSPSGIRRAFRGLSGFAETIDARSKKAQQPDEMLSARHLSRFLTENVEPGVASSYIIFTTHGTLLGYSSPLAVTTARNIAAITGLTWRANDSALLRGSDIGPITGGASLLKTLETTQAEKGPGLFNMICEYKRYLMSVQWIKPGFLIAAMTELDPEPVTVKGKGKFSIGAGSEPEGDEDWEDDGAVEETSGDEEDRAKVPSKKSKLFQKSQALASALREQWKVDNFKMPPGFR
ncbi:MAG: hypothetical protein Q9178_002908 [Gyalolechia marmorata]